MNIPINEIPDRIDEISKGKIIAVFCPADFSAAIVYAYMLAWGFSDICILQGGNTALTSAMEPGKLLNHLLHNKKQGGIHSW